MFVFEISKSVAAYVFLSYAYPDQYVYVHIYILTTGSLGPMCIESGFTPVLLLNRKIQYNMHKNTNFFAVKQTWRIRLFINANTNTNNNYLSHEVRGI